MFVKIFQLFITNLTQYNNDKHKSLLCYHNQWGHHGEGHGALPPVHFCTKVYSSQEQFPTFSLPQILLPSLSSSPTPILNFWWHCWLCGNMLAHQKHLFQDGANICTALKNNILWIHEVTWPSKYMVSLMHMVIFRPILITSMTLKTGKIQTFSRVFPFSLLYENLRSLLFHDILLNLN